MEMLLMGICISLFGMAVTAAAFGAATRPASPEPEPAVEREAAPAAIAAGNFFADRHVPAVPVAAQVPIAALLLQLESHVRMEQAAAESFVAAPTVSLLHTRTMSPFVN